MKEDVFVIISCVLLLVLGLGSCKSNSESKDDRMYSERVKEIKTLDDAIDALEKYCKEGNKKAVLDTYEKMTRIALDVAVEGSKSGKDPDSVFSEEQSRRLEMLDCDCVSDEELAKVVSRVQAEY
ncbi:MAG: hypothetical protein J5709_08030 [Bacteroidales bacterium]|nr:hypothetical protein [Bacteroidales bacterium]